MHMKKKEEVRCRVSESSLYFLLNVNLKLFFTKVYKKYQQKIQNKICHCFRIPNSTVLVKNEGLLLPHLPLCASGFNA